MHGPASLSEALHAVLRWGPIVQMGKPRLDARELQARSQPLMMEVQSWGKQYPCPDAVSRVASQGYWDSSVMWGAGSRRAPRKGSRYGIVISVRSSHTYTPGGVLP